MKEVNNWALSAQYLQEKIVSLPSDMFIIHCSTVLPIPSIQIICSEEILAGNDETIILRSEL